MQHASNKETDQPAHLHLRRLISAFVVRCLDSLIPIFAISKISRLLIVAVTEQAGLSCLVMWLKYLVVTGSDSAVHISHIVHRPKYTVVFSVARTKMVNDSSVPRKSLW